VRRFRFAPVGMLALEAGAYGQSYSVSPVEAPVVKPAVAIVSIRGPLVHHPECIPAGPFGVQCTDSYDAIRERAGLALASPARCVLLDIDSPGGVVSGVFDLAQDLRAAAAAAGKPLYAFVSGSAASGAYAIACAAEHIWIAKAGRVGSIGVIDTSCDQTKLDAQLGLRFAIVTSGARKADGNPHVPITDEAVAAMQANVDAVAAVFFAVVAEARALSVKEVKAFEAISVHGEQAVAAGLADEVATIDQVLAILASGAAPNAEQESEMYKKAIAALRATAKGEDKEEAKKAKAALAAMGVSEDEDEPSTEDDKDKDDEPSARGDEEEEAEEPNATAAATGPAAAAPAPAAASPVPAGLALKDQIKSELRAELRAELKEANERRKLLATRPDLTPKMVARLTKLPLADVRELLAEMPKPAGGQLAAARAAVAPGITPTLGQGQGDGRAAQSAPEVIAELDERMGLAKPKPAIRREGTAIVFGVMSHKEAGEALARNGAAQ
jgi:signal peptide peptidase SppA